VIHAVLKAAEVPSPGSDNPTDEIELSLLGRALHHEGPKTGMFD
jgi:hypothetical protein